LGVIVGAVRARGHHAPHAWNSIAGLSIIFHWWSSVL
jgi:hypothetical protein